MLKKFEVQWRTSGRALLLTAPLYQTVGLFVVLHLFVHSHNMKSLDMIELSQYAV